MSTIEVQRPDLYIKKLVFKNGETLETEKGDIVVFVGSNNVGKSRLLKDIFDLAGMYKFATILEEIKCSKSNVENIECWCGKHLSVATNSYGTVYSGYGLMSPISKNAIINANTQSFRELRDVVICFLNTESRLLISKPAEGVGKYDSIKSPIQALLRDANLLKKVTSYVKKAFGTSISPRVGKTIPLCIGPDICKEEISGETMQEVEANYLQRLESYPQLQDQGDGMRSFIGMILWFMLEHYNIFLVDEPETFLHPPQATLIGSIVGELITGERQAFIATHSIHFINGLLEKAPNRVKIIRVTRTENTNAFSILDNVSLCQISKDPYLKYSSLLEGMFYKNVVLCEGDADCMFYSMINSASDMKGEKNTDTLFTHCGGKHRMAKVLGALKKLNVEVKVIPDFDMLNKENLLKELIQACGGNWDCIKKDYNVLISDVKQRSNSGTTGQEVLEKIQEELADVLDKEVTPTKMRSIREMLESNTEWDRLKKIGVNGVGHGNPRQACEAILNYLKTLGIYVVPCGELECFLPRVGGHGPDWLLNVIEQFPDTSNNAYDAAKEFVRAWGL